MSPIRQGDGTGLSLKGFNEARKGDGTVLWSAGSQTTNSQLARYEFEQDFTDSWNSNDATEGGVVDFSTTAQVGSYSADLDSTSDYIETPFNSLSTPFSIAIWVNLRQTSGIDAGKAAIWSSYGGGSNDIYLWTTPEFVLVDDTSTSINTGVSATTNSWVHLTAVRADGELKAYVDGNIQGTASASANTFDANTLQIGRFGDGTRNMDGLVDDARIYDKALLDSEVSNLYSTGSISG